nr:hypothetical protein [Tanacetum cinerariifolium]
MKYWIINNDMNIWKVIQNGNSLKRTRRDSDGGLIILPPTTAKEHIAVQRESKAITTLLQSIPDDHIADFHYIDDARDIWNAFKARFGGNAESRKIRKSMLKQEFSKFRISKAEGLYKGVHKFEQKVGRKIDFDKKESARFNKQKVRCYKCQQRGHFAEECMSKGGNDKKRYSSFKIKEIGKKEEDSKALITIDTLVDWTNHDSESDGVIAAKEFGMIAGCNSKDAIKEGATKLYNLINGANSEEANTTGDAGEFAFMGVTSEPSTSCDPKYVRNDVVSYNDSDKSLEDNINDFASSDPSLNSSEPKPTDSSCASTSSVSTSVNEAENESNVETPIKEPISVQDLPSFTCISFDKTKHTSRTSCNKNDSFNKKAGHFRKYASFVSMLCFVCGSGTHLIKDCDFYKKQMTNTTVEIGVGPAVRPQPVPTGKLKVKPVPTGKLKDTLVPTGTPKVTPVLTGKPKVKPLPTGKPTVTPVPTGKPHVFTPVLTDRPNRPFLVTTNKGYTPSVMSDGQLRLSPQQVVLAKHIEKVVTGYPRTTETPFSATEDEGIFYSGCSRSMTSNKERLDDFQAFHDGKVTFGGGEGRITGKGMICTPTLDFENVYYVKELQQFNLFSISQICDKKNQVLFTDTECLVLSKDFQLPDDNMVVLKVLRKHNLYTINLNDLFPKGNLACLVAHASFDESVKWHRRMVHVNHKNMNRLVKGNLVRGLPSKLFKNGHTCVACCKGFVGFFWEHKDETYLILKKFINVVENQLNKKVKAIICDNGTEFKNAQMIELYGSKGIKMEYINPRTPQQNGVAERKNRTLIEAAITMLADSKLPTMFWTEAVRTACYVLNRVLVTSPHNQAPYALLTGNIPTVSHFKPFGCHVTILNTSDHLGKFYGKADEGYIVGYSASNKAYGVYNVPTKRVEELMDLWFLKDKTNLTNLQAHKETQIILQRTQPMDTPGDKVDDYSFPSADDIFQKELARLTVPPGCIPVPTGNVPVPTSSVPVPTVSIPVPDVATMVPSNAVPVHASSSTDSIFDGEPTTRFLCPSDLGNHNPSPGIFSSLSYDDEFDTALTNVASSVERDNHTDFQHCLFASFLSQVEPRNVAQALEDPRWVDAMQEEMQLFKFQNVWVLVDLPPGKYAIMTKCILKNKRDARGIVFRNKARLVAQGHRQEEGIDYDEVFAPVYKVVKALYGLHQAPRSWYATLSTFLLKHGYKQGTINKTLFLKKNNRDIILVQQRPDGSFIYQDKYVHEILNKFDLGNVRTTTTPYEAPKPKSKSKSDSPVNVHLYRSMIGSLMYLTALRPDIMFAVSTCSRHQVTPTTSNLEAVKKIFKYLKGQPKLGLWYPKESPLVLEAYSDSDYAGANKD